MLDPDPNYEGQIRILLFHRVKSGYGFFRVKFGYGSGSTRIRDIFLGVWSILTESCSAETDGHITGIEAAGPVLFLLFMDLYVCMFIGLTLVWGIKTTISYNEIVSLLFLSRCLILFLFLTHSFLCIYYIHFCLRYILYIYKMLLILSPWEKTVFDEGPLHGVIKNIWIFFLNIRVPN